MLKLDTGISFLEAHWLNLHTWRTSVKNCGHLLDVYRNVLLVPMDSEAHQLLLFVVEERGPVEPEK